MITKRIDRIIRDRIQDNLKGYYKIVSIEEIKRLPIGINYFRLSWSGLEINYYFKIATYCNLNIYCEISTLLNLFVFSSRFYQKENDSFKRLKFPD